MTEKLLLIDIFCLWESYDNGNMTKLGWICSQNNIADAQTKEKNSSAMQNVLKSHRVRAPVEQWIDEGSVP